MRQKRLANGLSMETLANICGVARQNAEKWENGITRMTAGRIYDVAVALGVHPGYFFDGYSELPTPTDMGEEFREITNAEGIQALVAMNRLTLPQKAIVRAVIDALEKANLWELANREKPDDGGGGE